MKEVEEYENPAKGTLARIGSYTGRYLGRAGRFDLWRDIDISSEIAVYWARDATPEGEAWWIRWTDDAATDPKLASLFTPAEFCDWYELVLSAQHKDSTP